MSAKSLYCINAKPTRRALRSGLSNIGLVQGGVYTETGRYCCSCGDSFTYVWVAEARFPGHPQKCWCPRCKRDITHIWGAYALKRFRELPGPNELGIHEEDVRKLYGPRELEKT